MRSSNRIRSARQGLISTSLDLNPLDEAAISRTTGIAASASGHTLANQANRRAPDDRRVSVIRPLLAELKFIASEQEGEGKVVRQAG